MTEKNKKISVLVVDDQPKLLKFIEIDLKLRGFNVTTTSSGKEALEIVFAKNPDIVLLDMIMPGMDGFEVLKKLRTCGDLPVIAFSASPGNQDLAMDAGATDFMHKPFDPDLMAQKIRAFIR